MGYLKYTKYKNLQKDSMAELQSKFQNFNSKVNQNEDDRWRDW